MVPVVLVNRDATRAERVATRLAELVPDLRHQSCSADEIDDALDRAARDGAEAVVVAGGDGTIAAAARRFAHTATALVPAPAGWRNHFARALGFEDVEATAAALADPFPTTVHLGEVNGELFVNTANLGGHAEIVRRRDGRASFSKTAATARAALEHLVSGEPLAVTIDGRPRSAWMVFVGNGRFGEGRLDPFDPRRFERPVLDVRVVDATRPLARVRTAIGHLGGRLQSTLPVDRLEVTDLEIDVARGPVDASVDGEIRRLASPLRYSVAARALTVLAPPTSRLRMAAGRQRGGTASRPGPLPSSTPSGS